MTNFVETNEITEQFSNHKKYPVIIFFRLENLFRTAQTEMFQDTHYVH